MTYVKAAPYYWYASVEDVERQLRLLPAWHPDVDGLLEARAALRTARPESDEPKGTAT